MMLEDREHISNNILFKGLFNCADHIKHMSSLCSLAIGKKIEIDPANITLPPDIWHGNKNIGYDILQGLYSFAGFSYRSLDVAWEIENSNDSWLFSMHSFEMLKHLKAIGGDRARQHARYLIANWLNSYWNWDSLSWRSDIMARRIVNWLASYSIFCASADEEFVYRVLDSLIRQTKYLEKNLNKCDLLYDSKALIYSGLAFNVDSWLKIGTEIVIKSIQKNILLDGGHASRAPEKHLIFLQNLLDIRTALNMAGIEIPQIVQHCIRKMAIVLRTLRQNDGCLPVFHGGGEGKASICDMVFGQVGGGVIRPLKSLNVMGYDRLSQGRTTIFVDTGQVTNKKQHLSLGAFEFSAGKDRIIVNCGAWSAYDVWKKALRSTAAHSALVIANANSVNIDADGRIAEFEVKTQRNDKQGKSILNIEHSGYLSRFSIIHRRSLFLENSGCNFIGNDEIIIKNSNMIGTNFAIRFHLHPNICVSTIKSGKQIILKTQTGQGWIFSTDFEEFYIEDSVYVNDRNCENPRKTKQIVILGRLQDIKNKITWQFEKI